MRELAVSVGGLCFSYVRAFVPGVRSVADSIAYVRNLIAIESAEGNSSLLRQLWQRGLVDGIAGRRRQLPVLGEFVNVALEQHQSQQVTGVDRHVAADFM